MTTDRKPVVLIAGPTASGKSAAALALAEAANGVVINADALQVYADLEILTARPGAADLVRAPHRLYGHVPARQAWSVARWLAEARAEIAACWREGQLPIVTGGTGLYFMALEQGLAEVPEIPASVREEVRAQLAAEGAAALHAELARLDAAEAARLRPSDSQRIARALEVLRGTGRPLSHWQAVARPSAPLAEADVLRFYLEPPRAELYARCDARFTAMRAAGAMGEVKALLEQRLDPALPIFKAIGVAELAAEAAGELSSEQAEARAQTTTRNYAKRQMTWARRNMIAWEKPETKFSESVLARVFAFIRKKG